MSACHFHPLPAATATSAADTASHHDNDGVQVLDSSQKHVYSIGRSLENDWIVDHPTQLRMISRHHATLRYTHTQSSDSDDEQSHQWSIADNKSANGVYINDSAQKLTGKHVLSSGDVVSFGQVRFQFHVGQPTADCTNVTSKAAAPARRQLKVEQSSNLYNTSSSESANGIALASSAADDSHKLRRRPKPTAASTTAADNAQPAAPPSTSPQGGSKSADNIIQFQLDYDSDEVSEQKHDQPVKAEPAATMAASSSSARPQPKPAVMWGAGNVIDLSDSESDEEVKSSPVSAHQSNNAASASLKREQVNAANTSAALPDVILPHSQSQTTDDVVAVDASLERKTSAPQPSRKRQRDGSEKVKGAHDKHTLIVQDEEHAPSQMLSEHHSEGDPLTDRLQDELQCLVCTELYVHPVVMPCGHCLCLHPCFLQCIKQSDRCPQCRATLTAQPPTLLRNLHAICKIVTEQQEGQHSDQSEQRQARLKQYDSFCADERRKHQQLKAAARSLKAGQFMQITNAWTADDKQTFAAGMTRYELAESRAMYASLVGLTDIWMEQAALPQLIVACHNVGTHAEVKVSPVDYMVPDHVKRRRHEQQLRRLLRLFIAYGYKAQPQTI